MVNFTMSMTLTDADYFWLVNEAKREKKKNVQDKIREIVRGYIEKNKV